MNPGACAGRVPSSVDRHGSSRRVHEDSTLIPPRGGVPLARLLIVVVLAVVTLVVVAVGAAAAQETTTPKVDVTSPAADARTDRDSMQVVAVVSDERGVRSVRVSVNGERVPLDATPDPGQPPRMFRVNVRVPLAVGENVVVLTASNTAGKVVQVPRTVTRVAPPPGAPAGKADRYAVLIGIGTYEHRSMPPLRFAERDVQALYDFLTTKGGYAKENVVLLTDSGTTKPTQNGVGLALGNLVKRAGKDDAVLIYFAGRGGREMDSTGRERDGLAKYLIVHDTDPESLYATGFAFTDLEAVFRRIRSDRVVLLLDADFSGNPAGRSFSRQTTRTTGASAEFKERFTRASGRVLITASSGNEPALEAPDLKHGLFTHFVLQGLDGAADRDRDGFVTVSELYGFVQGKVSEYARRLGARQTPSMEGAMSDLPLLEVPRR